MAVKTYNVPIRRDLAEYLWLRSRREGTTIPLLIREVVERWAEKEEKVKNAD